MPPATVHPALGRCAIAGNDVGHRVVAAGGKMTGCSGPGGGLEEGQAPALEAAQLLAD